MSHKKRLDEMEAYLKCIEPAYNNMLSKATIERVMEMRVKEAECALKARIYDEVHEQTEDLKNRIEDLEKNSHPWDPSHTPPRCACYGECKCYYCSEARNELTEQRRSDYGLGNLYGKQEGLDFARRQK